MLKRPVLNQTLASSRLFRLATVNIFKNNNVKTKTYLNNLQLSWTLWSFIVSFIASCLAVQPVTLQFWLLLSAHSVVKPSLHYLLSNNQHTDNGVDVLLSLKRRTIPSGEHKKLTKEQKGMWILNDNVALHLLHMQITQQLNLTCSQNSSCRFDLLKIQNLSYFIIRWMISSASMSRLCELSGIWTLCKIGFLSSKHIKEGDRHPASVLYLFFLSQINFYSDWGVQSSRRDWISCYLQL